VTSLCGSAGSAFRCHRCGQTLTSKMVVTTCALLCVSPPSPLLILPSCCICFASALLPPSVVPAVVCGIKRIVDRAPVLSCGWDDASLNISLCPHRGLSPCSPRVFSLPRLPSRGLCCVRGSLYVCCTYLYGLRHRICFTLRCTHTICAYLSIILLCVCWRPWAYTRACVCLMCLRMASVLWT